MAHLNIRLSFNLTKWKRKWYACKLQINYKKIKGKFLLQTYGGIKKPLSFIFCALILLSTILNLTNKILVRKWYLWGSTQFSCRIFCFRIRNPFFWRVEPCQDLLAGTRYVKTLIHHIAKPRKRTDEISTLYVPLQHLYSRSQYRYFIRSRRRLIF